MKSGDFADIQRRMEGAINAFKHDLASLRTGRASSNLLDAIQVKAYGTDMPLNQVANVTVPEPRMISVSVWDKAMVSSVDRAIREANLGFNPIVDGTNLRIPLPELNEQRRKELVKIAHGYAENARVAIRHVRRDGMDFLKKSEKDGDISEDDHRREADSVQKLTDDTIASVDSLLAAKEAEIMQV
ncbi:MAG: ribosome recycling factor [Alphaproteobacteria bacterium]|jgi:ribosome recycling factor|nr:ribosome recycling factor [Alphaproteobacteria bacterium]MBU0802800.1 ribosome recycling factor [Alphaproteobacteria bacterium]MBU0871597.1 ribosome recycling factor [Alphaproteobacteria bacterium]MBU1400264.1 ribosome recycling factor [Alphaproteobacteria bacterium]MBU1591384.1 ribosome recycling factor [Alphaproteobacteria bacterium]